MSSPVGYVRGEYQTICDWWYNIQQRYSLEDCNFAAVLMWTIWSNRNNQVWHLKSKTAGQLVLDASTFLYQWNSAQCFVVQQRTSSSLGSVKWQKPSAGYISCNVDAALFTNAGQFEFGCVARDANGSFIAARCNKITWPSMCSTTAEALSLREALGWLKKKIMRQVIVESIAERARIQEKKNGVFGQQKVSTYFNRLQAIGGSW